MKRMGCSVGMLVDFIANMALETAKKKFEWKDWWIKIEKSSIWFRWISKEVSGSGSGLWRDRLCGLDGFLVGQVFKSGCWSLLLRESKTKEGCQRRGSFAACSYCNANSAEAQKRVETIIYNCLDIIRNFFKSDVNVKEYLLAGDIVDGVTEVINEKLEPIQGNVSEINDNLKLLNIYSPEAYAKLAKNGNLEEIQNRFDSIFYSMNKQHPFISRFWVSDKR